MCRFPRQHQSSSQKSHALFFCGASQHVPCSRVSIGWAVDYLLAEDTNTKPNPNLGLDLGGGKHTPPSPPLFDIHCCIILCNKGCRRQSLWGQCLGGMSCKGKGVNVTKNDSSTGPLSKLRLMSRISERAFRCHYCYSLSHAWDSISVGITGHILHKPD